jgi:hypothetical protein
VKVTSRTQPSRVEAVAGETTVVLVTAAGADDEEDPETKRAWRPKATSLKEKKDSSGLTTLGWASWGGRCHRGGRDGLKTLSARRLQRIRARDPTPATRQSCMTLNGSNCGYTAGAGLGILLLVPTDKDSAGVVVHGRF